MLFARRFFAITCFLVTASAAAEAATIKLEAIDRFRFFAHQEDFETHLETFRAAGRSETSPVLSTEHKFYESGNKKGRGWAEAVVGRTCWDPFRHEFSFRCIRGNPSERDRQKKGLDAAENYFNPQYFKISATLEGAPADATCKWQMQDGDAKTIHTGDNKCAEHITFRLPIKPGTTLSKVTATVQITDSGKTEKVEAPEKTFRHLRIAGIGDSIASGEGNPDKPVTFDASRTLCYLRSVLNYNSGLTPRQEKNQYWRPGRLGFLGDAGCTPTQNQQGEDRPSYHYTWEQQRASWSVHSAGWLSPGCHRSMYGNQFRSALQVAIERDDVTVTYIPLGCTGATIRAGLLGGQPAREIYCPPGIGCHSWMPAQVDKLDEYRRYFAVPPKAPAYDAILLTIGANDMGFSGLVASVMFDAALEKLLQRWGIGFVSAEKAEEKLGDLPEDFRKLANRLNRLVGDDLRRVVFTTYPNPATHSPGKHCPEGRAGLDVHPQMYANAAEMKKGWELTQKKFLPLLEEIANCPLKDKEKCGNRFTFVNAHQSKFEDRGYCTRSAADPDFDKECFWEDGNAFFHATRPDGSAEPNFGKLRCPNFKAADYPAFVKRQRWIRSPNDSYFAANTFPDGLSRATALSDPFNLIWAANYGGAFHPTAEGHAAIADEILLKLRGILK